MATTLEKFKEIVGEKMADLKQLFEVPATPVVEATATFADVKTADGTILRIEGDKVAGSKCMVITPDGEQPAEGEYKLEDGAVVIAKAGVIESVTPAMEEEAKVEPNKMDAELAEVKEGVKSITYKYAEIEKLFNEKFEGLTKENEKLSAQNKAMFAVIEKMASLPSDEPAQTPAQPIAKTRLQEFRESVKELKANRRALRNESE